MKFSLITPTHKNTPYLEELYYSILGQTYTDWEWVVWLNGDFDINKALFLSKDERIKVFLDKSNDKNVGYHKKQAFMRGTGNILVELDHDDLLLENCLEELYKAYQDPEIGFVYSDNAKLTDNFTCYDKSYGWKFNKHKVEILGEVKELWCPISFKPTSHSMNYIWYMPDHVRSWRKTVYHEIGGHNENYEILDDQELMQRTYLKTKFKKIDKCLYLYRIHGKNTWLEKSKDIQKKTFELGYKNSQILAERDAELKKLLKVDLGGGINKKPGYLSIDKFDADICCDLEKGIPLEDNSVGVINASHIIEHLKDPIFTMKEIHRVLCHGGWAFIEVPSTDGRGAWQDPTHVSFWNENSFLYYIDKNVAKYIRNDSIRFMSYRLETLFPNDYFRRLNIPVVKAHLIALKNDEERFPGIINI